MNCSIKVMYVSIVFLCVCQCGGGGGGGGKGHTRKILIDEMLLSSAVATIIGILITPKEKET